MKWEDDKKEEKIKADLLKKLQVENALWSFNKSLFSQIPDDLLIEKVLIHLDIDSISSLLTLFPKKMIRNIWKVKMLSQEPMYHQLNRLYAFLYFDISNPDRYIRDSINKKYKSIQCRD
ncbi:MAG: hypothetical protein A2X05_13795 [Bacteroidetes bacterium GWE2_41_25]|nr:MAG: hypothetical protein A2X03_13220 [Bacteroidetes bacterium GWA2_40_15]OFX98557.1 MAG: hypothetical protein A2X06_03485 [Bacteroidetes bacterium GWC2_40_22]OFY13167.1 MAG: hypothetical protein A2X05_13795 [Bacteroidetes bacterium GWE2_41_25]OFY57425.1 MAG: hypothetical protein A2X04_16245 [Bacteroidetes bacterium GWF2_41_9]